jgi:tRNA threonylcarbamoyl adenosine modification protein (Sua5/YciO/YrdC/YwlC family)
VGAVGDAVRALEAGGLVVLATDTVYGLAARPEREPVERLLVLKRKPAGTPVALVAASVDVLLALVPELRGRDEAIVRALLPGPYTLVLANRARRFSWLCGATPEAIGVRVPDLAGDAAAILHRIGAVAATSANLHGGADPRTLAEVPGEIRAAALLVDGGELPGTASTVIDFTGPEPRVIREGAAPSAEAIARVAPPPPP